MSKGDCTWGVIGCIIGLSIGASAVWVLTRPKIDSLERKIDLLEDHINEFQTIHENDIKTLREEHIILNKQIQELWATALTPENKQKIEQLFQVLEQTYQTKQIEDVRPSWYM